ncbi:hypothetical protein PG993_012885 [Apiospora rasikravindrae]|uniref:Uncharacterized protein n=1 Tax=Apiospora rasikravindrae TaxID=990691 RepID=A0ABR1RWH4_9PEZI
MADCSQVSFTSQSQALLESPTEYKSHYGSDVDEVDASGLQEAPIPSKLSPPTAPSGRQARHFWHRIGMYGLLLVSIGSLLLIGSMLFLCYLWLGAGEARRPEAGEPSKIWQYFVFLGWLTRAVTISAAVIRSVITAQATVLAAMIAAILVESTGLARPVSTSFRVSPGAVYLPLIIIMTSCVLTLGSQLASTILLSDFGIANIARPADFTNRLVSTRTPTTLFEPWKSPPQAFWRFAEHHEQNREQNNLSHIADTGRTLRAALPWVDQKSRVNLRSYSGPTEIWDARVVCHGPELTNASFVEELDAESKKTAIRSQGSVVYNETDYPLPPGEQLGPDFYNCTIPREVAISICRVSGSSRLKSLVYESSEKDNTTSSAVDGYILFSLESPDSDLPKGASGLNFTQGQSGTVWSARREGPWTRILNPSGNRVLSLSHCVNDGNIWNVNVTMNGTSTESEPALGWIPSKTWSKEFPDGKVDTSKIRMQLGTTREILSPQARGILSLHLPKSSAEDTVPSQNGDGAPLPTLVLWDDYQGSLNFIHRQLFNDIINSTENPSLAIQALFTVFNQMRYFDTSYMWLPRSQATYVIAEDVSIPTTNTGLGIVLAMAITHLVLIAGTVVLFLRRTEVTLIGNAWQSVAQVVSDDTLPTLDRAGDLRDKEVKKILAESSEGPEMTGVIRRRNNGRVQFGEK